MAVNVLTKKLWARLGDIPIDENECIEAPFYIEADTPLVLFPAGTHREEVWRWFEDTFDLSVAEDLMCVPCARCGEPLPAGRGYPDANQELCDRCLVEVIDCHCVSIDIPGCDQSCPGCRAAARLAHEISPLGFKFWDVVSK